MEMKFLVISGELVVEEETNENLFTTPTSYWYILHTTSVQNQVKTT